jgi:hypothetical protein
MYVCVCVRVFVCLCVCEREGECVDNLISKDAYFMASFIMVKIFASLQTKKS